MRRTALSRRRPARILSRVVATGVVTALGIAGLPGVAFADDGTVGVTSTNSLAGVSSALNTASATVVISTTSAFAYATSPVPVAPTVTFTRTGTGTAGTAGSDTITAAITTADSPSAKSFTLTVPLTSANPGTYDIKVSGQTVPPGAAGTTPQDVCTGCFTVLSASPSISSISPTAIAQSAAVTLTVTGSGFARGNYTPSPNSNYACSACTAAPLLQVRVHGVSSPAAGFSFSDPLNGANQQVAVPATSTTITKVITVSASVTPGTYDVYVKNTNAVSSEFTLANALTVDAAPTISAVSAQSSVPGAPAGTTLGQGSNGGTITVTGANFPPDTTGTISYTGQTSDITYSFVRDSSTQVRFTSVAPSATAATGARTIRLSSASNGGSVTSSAFSVSAKPVPAASNALSLPDSFVGAYGRGATGVRVTMTGSGFTSGVDASGAQLVFTPATGITVVSQSTTAGVVTAYITLGASTPTGSNAVTVTVQNPDGGTNGCSTACTFGVNAAPQITSVTPNSEARGQTALSVAIVGTNLADGTNKHAPQITIGHATHGAVAATSATAVTVANVAAGSTAVGAQDIMLQNGDDAGRTTCVGCFTITTLAVDGPANASGLNTGVTGSTTTSGNGFDPAATVSLVKTGSGSATVPAIPGTVVTPPTETTPGAADGTSIDATYDLTGVDPGTYAFQVTNPGGSPFPGVGQGGLFNVVSAAPTLTSVAPASRGAGAVNQTVVLTGTNFGPHATVVFSSSAVHIDSVTHNSANQITVVLHIDQDAAQNTGTVTVTNTDTQSANKPFTVAVGPHISDVQPNNRGQGAASTTITFSGTPFSFPTAANTSLTFAGGTGVAATGFTYTAGSAGTPPVVPATPDTLTGTLTVTGTATVGSYDIVLVDTSTGGRYVCTSCFAVHAKPTLASVTPFDGAVGTSVPVTLAGTGFRSSPTVTATDGVTVSNVLQTSPTSITATFAIPAGATRDALADVTVTNLDGGFISLVDAFHLFGRPDAPTAVTAVPGNAKATASWTAPTFDGGSPITGYTVTAAPGGASASAGAGATSVDVPGLANGTSYTFSVHATNAAGNGTESAPSNATTPRTVPGKPTGVSGTPSDRSVMVSWTAPTSNGGSALTGYTVTAAPGGATATVDGATTSAAVTGLTNGTAYTFTVHATNVAGDSAESDPSSAATPRTVPAAPTGVAATPGNAQATVSWTAPADNGGAALTGYTVTASPGGATAPAGAGATSADVTGLTNGTAYTFTVHATNVAGNSPESVASNATTPRTVPGKPTGAAATPGDGSAVVSWTAPASDGGSPVTGYTVTSSPGGLTATVAAPATSATMTGLTNGTGYTFTVHATNVAGSGAESDPSSQVTPVTNATAPSAVTATPGNAKATVSWTVPASDGGSSITSYTVTSTPADVAPVTISAASTSTDVTGLTNGTAYTFTVHATNGTGPGPESAASNAVTPRTVPGKPTAVSATAGNGSASVGWTAPASTGGAAITGYTVTASPGGATTSAPASASSITVSGLTNGTAYTFTVHATNVAGASAESDPSSAVTPATLPGVPSGVTATPGNASATVSWTAPASDGGSALTGYTVTASGGITKTVSAGTTSTSVTGLTNGTAYTFTVHATNAVGSSTESAPSGAVTPRTVPGVPTGVSAVPADRSATVSWTAPVSDGGSEVTGYSVTSTPASPGATVTGNPAGTSVVVTGLTNGTAYTFTVHATNVAGSGAESAASTAVTPATVPGKPTGISAVGGNNQATVSWTAPTDNGGSVITGYTVTSSPGGFTKTVAGDQSQATVTGLTNGATYTFTAIATNAKGDSAASDASAPITLAIAPDAPSNVSATPGNGQATVTWSAPASNGGATVTSYTVTPSPSGTPVTVTGNPAPTMAAVTGLTNGTAYTFTVVAHNSAGNSVASGASSAVTPSATPTAPQAVTAEEGDASVHVTWAAPTSTGGSPITHYLVSLNSGAPVVVGSAARSVDFGGLTNGTSYTAAVVAQNANGNSPSAAAAPVTPKFETATTIVRSASIITYGGTATISGRLIRSNGAPLPSRSVQVYSKTYPATTYSLLATRTTNSNGQWSLGVKPSRLTSYGALFLGDTADWDTFSAATTVAVRFRVAGVSPTAGSTVRAGTISFKARVYPALTGTAGYLMQRRSDGSVIGVAKASVSSSGYLVLSRKLARGTYSFAYQVNGTKGCSTARTAFFTLHVS